MVCYNGEGGLRAQFLLSVTPGKERGRSQQSFIFLFEHRVKEGLSYDYSS
jgi:hypothetical protein